MTDNPCAVSGDQSVSDQITAQYANRMTNLSNNLIAGGMTLDQWQQKMEDAIRLSFNHQAIAGAPDSDVRNITSDDRDRMQAAIAEQYDYLHGFAQDIADAQDAGDSLDFIPARAAMYAEAAQSEYWRQATNVELPAYPRDGSTQCLGNCQCSWELDCDEDGNVNARWVLGDADHCPDCVQRSQEWNPLVIPAGDVSNG